MYQATLKTLELVPPGYNRALVIRHAERESIDPQDIFAAMLTDVGIQSAREFGAELKKRYLPGKIMSAPVLRCIDTAISITRGAGWVNTVMQNKRLSHPYVQKLWDELPSRRVGDLLPGEVWDITGLILKTGVPPNNQLHLYVTHDTVLGTILGYLLNYPIDSTNWPGFLEGIVFWRDGKQVFAGWRDKVYDITEPIQAAK